MTSIKPISSSSSDLGRDNLRQPGTEWWRGATIYQVYPRSFADSNGDGVGDLPGITSRLDHIASLGVDGVWISPFFTSPMADFGYDVADYRDVDPIFGTLADFDELIARAHGLDLKVIIDQVYCHSSDQHRWFQSSKKSRTGEFADWYVWRDPRDDGSVPNNWLSVFGGPAWTWCGQRRQYYLHHFLKEQPAFNLHNPAVVDAMIDIGRFWIERGVDGFRLDALNMGMSDPQFRDNPAHPQSFDKGRPYDMQSHVRSADQPEMEQVVEKMAAAFRDAGGEDFFTVGELGGEDPHATMVAYTLGTERLSTAYSFDFIGRRGVDRDFIREIVSKWPNSLLEGYPAFSLSNHDMPRVASRWAIPGAPEGVAERLLALFEIALRGVIFIYQGEELGLPQAEIAFEDLVDPEAKANWPADQGRDGARTPIPWVADARHAGFSEAKPWLPVPATHAQRAVDVQDAAPESLLNFFRAALSLRKSENVLRRGDLAIEPLGADGLVITRIYEGCEALCAFNFGGGSITLPETYTDRDWTIRQSANLGENELGKLPPFSAFVAINEA